MPKKFKTYNLIPLLVVLPVVTFSCNFDIHQAMMPNEIQGLELFKKVTGKDAAEIISRLHMKDVSSQDNIILYYQSEQNQATIYVSYFQYLFLADKYIHEMRKKIREEDTGFSQYAQFKARGLDINSVVGYSQIHYFFAHYNYTFWLAIDRSIARKGLAQILEVDEIELPLINEL